MRTITSGDLTTLGATQVDHFLKVEIQNVSGTWIDFSSLVSIDWVDTAAIDGEGIDQPIATAQVGLKRSTNSVNLVPLASGSSANSGGAALDLGRLIRISVDVTAAGGTPTYREIFLGRIDGIAWENDPIMLDCSDLGAWLMDTQIESEIVYVQMILTSAEFTSVTFGANSIILAAGNPSTIYGGLKAGDTIAITGATDSANNKTVTVSGTPSSTTITTVESLTVNATANAAVTLTRMSSSIQNVMQKMLNDNTIPAGIDQVLLYVPVDPGFQIKAFKQQRKKLMEALRDLALLIGWEVRYRYDSSGNFKLTLFTPQREILTSLSATATGYARASGRFVTDIPGLAIGCQIWVSGFSTAGNNGLKTVTAFTTTSISCTGCSVEGAAASRSITFVNAVITPSIYKSIQKLNVGLADVRNAVCGKFVNTSGTPEQVTAINSASITAVKRRYMEIALDATSPLRTATEMTSLVTAAVSDLAQPKATHDALMLLYWPIQFGDFVVFTQNIEHYDTDQAFGVVGVRHDLGGGEGWTTLRTRGNVAGAIAGWLRRESKVITPTALPTPVITLEAEGTAGSGAFEGLVRTLITFDDLTDNVIIYASESATSAQVTPDQTLNRLAGIVRRQEGDIETSRTWKTEFDISTTVNYYRKVLCQPVGPQGQLGAPIVLEAQAIDTGTGPTGNVTSFAVAMSTTGGKSVATLTWANADANASIRIWRNGIIVARLAAGTVQFVDTGLTPGALYSYTAQAIRNGQTAGSSGGSPTSPTSPTLATPADWRITVGRAIGLNWTNPDASATTSIEARITGAGAWTYILPVSPGSTSATILAADVGGTPGQTWEFRARAIRTGYTTSSYTATLTGVLGTML